MWLALHPQSCVLLLQHMSNCNASSFSREHVFGGFYNRSFCNEQPIVAISVKNYVAVYAFQPSTGMLRRFDRLNHL